MNLHCIDIAFHSRDTAGLLMRVVQHLRTAVLNITLWVIPSLRSFMAPSNLAPRVSAAVARDDQCVKGTAIVHDALVRLAELKKTKGVLEKHPAPDNVSKA